MARHRRQPEPEQLFADRLYVAHEPFREEATHLVALAPGIACHVGSGRFYGIAIGEQAIVLGFDARPNSAVLTIAMPGEPLTRPSSDVLIVLDPEHCTRTFGVRPPIGRWHLPRELRVIVLAMLEAQRRNAIHPLYLQGKGLELLCEALALLSARSLTPCSGSDLLSEADTIRILKARALVEERYGEALTLRTLALACGVNRSKLTRGFGIVFGTTVATFLCSTRMNNARELLLTTDLMIATIAARCGFRNNASFSRAFCRYFGVAPNTVRTRLVGLTSQKTARRALEA